MSDQLDLFGAELPRVSAPDQALPELAARLPSQVRLGTSSWTFPGWAGIVYRERYANAASFTRESLREYARYPLFRTVGIDRSFYGPLRADELAAHAAQLPPGFPCVMKVWSELTTRVFPKSAGSRAGTVNRAFLDAARFREAVLAPVMQSFSAHLGAFLIEVPPAAGPVNPVGFADALDRFLAATPGVRFCVELRDKRLLTDDYLTALRRHGASHVFNYWSYMPELGDQLARVGELPGDFTVIRLMIPPGKRYEELRAAYDPFDRLHVEQLRMREDVMRIIDAAGGRETFVLVNNKVEGSSPLTVRALAELLAAR